MKIYEYSIKRTLIKETKDVYLNNRQKVIEVARTMIDFDRNQEQLLAIYLDERLNIKGSMILTIGTVSSSTISVSDVFKPAILCSATSIVVVHNHPSGNLEASTDDIKTTKAIKKSGELLDISLLDHIIITEDDSRSISI